MQRWEWGSVQRCASSGGHRQHPSLLVLCRLRYGHRDCITSTERDRQTTRVQPCVGSILDVLTQTHRDTHTHTDTHTDTHARTHARTHTHTHRALTHKKRENSSALSGMDTRTVVLPTYLPTYTHTHTHTHTHTLTHTHKCTRARRHIRITFPPPPSTHPYRLARASVRSNAVCIFFSFQRHYFLYVICMYGEFSLCLLCLQTILCGLLQQQ